MRKLAPFALVLACLLSSACSENPNVRTSDWEENFNQVNRLSAAGEHERAMTVSEAYLKKHPDNVDGLLMVAGALEDAAEAASDASRPARFEQAAQHYKRVLELTDNPNFRLLANSRLVMINGSQGLNRPDEAMRYAEAMIAANPKDLNTYSNAFFILREGKKYDEAVALLARARGTMESNADNWARYGEMVHECVFVPDFPRERVRSMVDDTVPALEQALSKYGRTERLLRAKAMLVRTQAEWETNSAKQDALLAEANRLYDESEKAGK